MLSSTCLSSVNQPFDMPAALHERRVINLCKAVLCTVYRADHTVSFIVDQQHHMRTFQHGIFTQRHTHRHALRHHLFGRAYQRFCSGLCRKVQDQPQGSLRYACHGAFRVQRAPCPQAGIPAHRLRMAAHRLFRMIDAFKISGASTKTSGTMIWNDDGAPRSFLLSLSIILIRGELIACYDRPLLFVDLFRESISAEK